MNIREGIVFVGNGLVFFGRIFVIFILYKGKRKLLYDELFF